MERSKREYRRPEFVVRAVGRPPDPEIALILGNVEAGALLDAGDLQPGDRVVLQLLRRPEGGFAPAEPPPAPIRRADPARIETFTPMPTKISDGASPFVGIFDSVTTWPPFAAPAVPGGAPVIRLPIPNYRTLAADGKTSVCVHCGSPGEIGSICECRGEPIKPPPLADAAEEPETEPRSNATWGARSFYAVSVSPSNGGRCTVRIVRPRKLIEPSKPGGGIPPAKLSLPESLGGDSFPAFLLSVSGVETPPPPIGDGPCLDLVFLRFPPAGHTPMPPTLAGAHRKPPASIPSVARLTADRTAANAELSTPFLGSRFVRFALRGINMIQRARCRVDRARAALRETP